MIKYTQSKFSLEDSKGNKVQTGDCLRTTLAALLETELSDTPNFETLFYLEDESIWKKVEKAWLAYKGFEYKYEHPFAKLHFRPDELTDEEKEFIKDKLYLAIGFSPRGVYHICIYKNGKLFWDVHPSRDGLIKAELFKYIAPIV